MRAYVEIEVEAEKRQKKRAVTKKEPASPELVKAIVTRCGHEDATLKDLRLANMCVLSFAGLFRSKELLDIRMRDIKWFDDHFVINVPQSKTDVYRQGQDVFIASSNEASCPGRLLDQYMIQKVNIKIDHSDVYSFRNLVYLKSTHSYTLGFFYQIPRDF